VPVYAALTTTVADLSAGQTVPGCAGAAPRVGEAIFADAGSATAPLMPVGALDHAVGHGRTTLA
jgi:hypothetical protein